MRLLVATIVAVLAAPLLASAHPHHVHLPGSYTVVALGPKAERPPAAQSVTFSADGSVSGNGGCNRFRGGYEMGDDRVRVSNVMATRMACAQNIMAAEQQFIEALQSGSVVMEDPQGQVRFIFRDGTHLLTLAPIQN